MKYNKGTCAQEEGEGWGRGDWVAGLRLRLGTGVTCTCYLLYKLTPFNSYALEATSQEFFAFQVRPWRSGDFEAVTLHRQRGGQTDRQTDRPTGRQTGRQANRQTGENVVLT